MQWVIRSLLGHEQASKCYNSKDKTHNKHQYEEKSLQVKRILGTVSIIAVALVGLDLIVFSFDLAACVVIKNAL